jgi:hypothetical protein
MYEEATEDQLLDALGEIAPVRILGRGPSYQARKFQAPCVSNAI